MIQAALFGGGCFWYVEPVLSALKGVLFVQVGYSGGLTHYPSHEKVHNLSQNAGHIEVVLVRYNPKVISFNTLLEVFYSIHDPCTINQQGDDVGPQYASAIFYTTEQQHQSAKQYIKKLEARLKKAVVTKLVPAEVFWPTEVRHSEYYLHNLLEPYSVDVIRPKLRAFSKSYNHIIKTKEDCA